MSSRVFILQEYRYDFMRYFIIVVFAAALSLVSCKHNQGPTNEYKNAKVHQSDREQKARKSADKQAVKQAHKNMRNARKIQRKKNRNWGKKGSYQ